MRLLSQLHTGDSTAYWKLWLKHEQELRRLCRRWTNGSPIEAEDILSNAMLKAHDKIFKHAHSISNFKGWVIRLTRNVFHDQYRESGRQATNTDNIDEIYPGNALHNNTAYKSAEEVYMQKENCEELYQRIAALPARPRNVLVLRLFYNMSYTSIAIKMGLSNENVRKRFQQAKDLLQKKISDNNRILATTITNQTWMFMQESAASLLALDRKTAEINIPCIATCSAMVTLNSNIRKERLLFLGFKPFRLITKAQTLEKYIEHHPLGWKKRLELAEIRYALGDWEAALELLQYIIKTTPRSLDAMLRMGLILADRGDIKQAISIFAKALHTARLESSRKHIMGLIHLCHNNFTDAVRTFTEATHLEQDNDTHFRMLGFCYKKTDQPFKAVIAFEQALKTNPQDIFSLHHSYECLIQLNRVNEAERYLDTILDIYPSDILALKRKIERRCARELVMGEQGDKTLKLIKRLEKIAPCSKYTSEAQTSLVNTQIRLRELGIKPPSEVLTKFIKKRNPD